MFSRLVPALFLSLFLLACATTSSTSKKDINTLIGSKYPNGAFIVDVESANNLISTKIMLASIKAGNSSSTSQAILKLLSNKNSTKPVVVTGADSNLAAATLERALVDGKGKVSGSKVVFMGPLDLKDSLSKAANDSGVLLDFVANP